MTKTKDETNQDINPPKTDRIGNDFREGPNPNPGGTIDTGDSLIPPYEDRTGEKTPSTESDDAAAPGAPELGQEKTTPSS